jgi:hypothetical protein
VSGEPAVQNAATTLRRQTKSSQHESIQDYIVVPNQLWLDGIASEAGKVRQFVAMSVGSGYSVEKQVTGEEVTGGIQFEIIPCKEYTMAINIMDENGFHKMEFNNRATIGEVKSKLISEPNIKFTVSDGLTMGGALLAGEFGFKRDLSVLIDQKMIPKLLNRYRLQR